MKVTILSGADVRRVLPMKDCIEAVRRGFAALASGQALMPLRQIVELPEQDAMLGWMPGWLGEPKCFGAKIVAVFPHNHAAGLGSHQGVVLVFEPLHGGLRGIVEGGTITALRTAAATAVATDLLARADAAELAILGYGQQAHAHVEALSLVRSLRGIRVWGRNPERARKFAREIGEQTGIDTRACDSVRVCVDGADMICTVSAAPEPILFRADVAAGTHVNAVGSSRAKEVEIDPALFAAAKVYADHVPGVLVQGGEFLRARAAGLIDDDHVLGSIGEVQLGRLAGRQSAADVTLFKSLGIVVEDLVSSQAALELAAQRGLGTELDMS
jgi:ornithine cyclodeaminase/alanine dehydrogenase-like protein (mu-crystallin family)